jgi:hypothetical protein
VNIDQLMESLSENAPDPDHVLASFGRKRHAARSRMYAACGGLAVAVVAVVAGVLLHGAGAARTLSAQSAPAEGAAVPAAAPNSPNGGLVRNGSASSASTSSGAAGCGTARLQEELAEAVRKGASVIVGYATLTSGAAAAQGAGSDATAYYSLTLRPVRTLAGPAVTSGSIAWIAGPSPAAGASAGGGSSTATAPGTATAQPRTVPSAGELFGVVVPSAGAGAPGPVLQGAQVTNGQVVLSGAGCWDITVPASGSHQGLAFTFGPSLGPAQSGAGVITEVPLATAEKLAAAAGKE